MKTLAVVAAAGLIASGVSYSVLRAPPAMPIPEPGLVLQNVVLIDPGAGRRHAERVMVRGDRIQEIRTAAAPTPGVGVRYVLPGLTDMHVHDPVLPLPGHDALFAFLYLYHGVTAVRNTGESWGLRERSGTVAEFPAPRVFSCGPKIDGKKQWWPVTLSATSAEEARAVVTDLVRHGYDCAKVYDDVDAETLDALAAAARTAGLPLIGHVPWRIPLDEAPLDDLQHLLGFDVVHADRPPMRPFRMLRLATMRDADLKRFVNSLRERGAAVTPTLITLKRKFQLADAGSLRTSATARLLPACYRDVYWHAEDGLTAQTVLTPEQVDAFRRLYPAAERLIRDLAAAGVRLHSGTDTPTEFVIPGAGLLEELALLEDAGLSRAQVLEIATRGSSAFLEVPALGTLVAGAPADFVVYTRDPTVNLSALHDIEAVVRGGRLYTRQMLDTQLDVYRRWYESPAYDWMTKSLFRIAIFVRNLLA